MVRTMGRTSPHPSDSDSDSDYIAISSGEDYELPPARSPPPQRRYFTRHTSTMAGAKRRPRIKMTRARPPPLHRSRFSTGASSSAAAVPTPENSSESRTRSASPPVPRSHPPPAPASHPLPSPATVPPTAASVSPPAAACPSSSTPATTTEPSPATTTAVPPPVPSSPATVPHSAGPHTPQSARADPSPPLPLIPPRPGNADCNERDFQDEYLYDFPAFASAPHTQRSIEICRRYFLEPFMLPRDFFYVRVVRAFYQTMTSRDQRPPQAIHFEIDGRHGVLTAETIADALGIPLSPLRTSDFQPSTPCHVTEQVSRLARGTPTYSTAILRRELDPTLWLVDHVLKSNLHPIQHAVQRRGDFLHALYCISQEQWFSPAHLVMSSLFYFEEKVHRKKLSRAQRLPLLLPRLLCLILERIGFPADPSKERRRFCREIFGLTRWHHVCTRKEAIFDRAFSSSSVEHQYTPPADLHADLRGDGPDSPVHRSTPPASSIRGPTPPHVPPPTASPGVDSSSPAMPSSSGSAHIAIPASDFSTLCSQVAMLQASNAQLVQRIEELTTLVLHQHRPPVTPHSPAGASTSRAAPTIEHPEDAATAEEPQP